ncbi:multiple sugar transport system substrate-binding protein [Lachnospiraceae bacterium XBB2008]|nr:multiple sugar transport system substrate-binding protein [Lachnospiraceae bacterium XBB2008]
MKIKKLLSLSLVTAMLVGTLAGCGSTGTDQPAAAGGSDTAATTTSDAGGSSDSGSDAAAADTSGGSSGAMEIEVYDAAANYQGLQTGWFDKVVKDRFNIDLNIIAPQVAGDAIYQTRTSSGNLGDIVLLDAVDFSDCVKAGLIKDISADIANYPNLNAYMEQIKVYNEGLEGNNGEIYGIPTQMMNTSPTSYSQDVIYSSPLLRWDYYSELGCPDIKDLDGLVDVLAQMQDAHPTNADGDPCYAVSLWPDWDGNDNMLGIANVVQLTTWYGEKIKDSAILKADGKTFTPITDKNATYYKMLKFLNTLYRKGLVDPDSGTQDWNAACAKMSAGQVNLFWYSWQVGFWNSQERLDNGTAMIFVPVADQNYYADADAYYGSGRVFGIGSGVDDEKYKTILEFLDWYASPEGLEFEHVGIKDFTYTVGDDGKFTAINDNALMDNLPVPEEYGGAGYSDGNNQINEWIVSANSVNPNTGEPYAKDYWASWKASTQTQMKKEWQEKFGAEEPADWMQENGKLVISPNVTVPLTSDTADISVIRNQCNETLCDYSWQMIFVDDDATFDSMWDEMTDTLDGMGFQDLYEFDCAKWQPQIDAKNALQ